VTTTYSNLGPTVSNRTQDSSGPTVRPASAGLATLLGVAMLAPLVPGTRSARLSPVHGAAAPHVVRAARELAPITRLAGLVQPTLTQGQDDDDDVGDSTGPKGASPDEIQKYVAVYRAMQRNHSITVEQAAATQGMSLAAFRDLEQRIENDDLARDDARRALAGEATPPATPKAR
jgi:hypothetical protein